MWMSLELVSAEHEGEAVWGLAHLCHVFAPIFIFIWHFLWHGYCSLGEISLYMNRQGTTGCGEYFSAMVWVRWPVSHCNEYAIMKPFYTVRRALSQHDNHAIRAHWMECKSYALALMVSRSQLLLVGDLEAECTTAPSLKHKLSENILKEWLSFQYSFRDF